MAGPTARQLGLRAVLSLPTPVLRAIAGGAAVHRGGRTLDPHLQFLVEAWSRRPPLHTLPPPEARTLFDRGVETVQGRLPAGVVAEPLQVPGGASERPARLYRPARTDSAMSLLVYAHSGGGVLGGVDTDHAFCGLLAAARCAPVLSIDYRLAPEHRFPAGLEDLAVAFRWARDHAYRFGATPGQAAVGGASIGAGFAALLCQQLKTAGEPQPDLQLLLYPATDLASEAPSMALFGDIHPLTIEAMAWFLAQYVGPDYSPADPRLSPLRAPDLSGLAPAVVATAGFDALCDQGDDYARRLREAAVPTLWRRYDSLCHGFASFTGVASAAEAACREIAALAAAPRRG